MEYTNDNRQALTWIAIAGLIGGAVIAGVATNAYSNELDSLFGPDIEALSSALAWQSIGAWAFGLGTLSLVARLIVGSVGYDLGYHAAEHAKLHPAPPAAAKAKAKKG